MANRVKRLFYMDPACEHCPVSVFDFKEDDWISNPRIEMEPGDHVVIDSVEKVYLRDEQYRDLAAGESAMWDETSVPAETLAVGVQTDDPQEDPYFRLQKRNHTLAHW